MRCQMKYEIKFKITDDGKKNNADSIEEAEKIAISECANIYKLLGGRCSVVIESIKEVENQAD